MSTLPWIKYDHGPLSINGNLTDLPANCFPVRNLLRGSSSNQQWVVALRDTEQRRFAAILTTLATPVQLEHDLTQQEIKKKQRWTGKEKTIEHLLDGFFIMHHCAIEDPSNVVILSVNGLELQEVKEEDFLLFDNVIQIDASENQLPFYGFKNFPQLSKLDLSFNQIKNIKINMNDYETLEELNLSYNNLTMHDIEVLGLLPNLRVLRASGNDLIGLSRRLTKPYVHTDIHGKEYVKERFPRLEELYLDHNKLAEDELFIHLSCLKNLKRLHLQHNQIRTIPFLKVLQGRHIIQEYSKTALKRKKMTTPVPQINYFQHGLSTSDELIKSTIFEEDEENHSSVQHKTNPIEDEDVSLPAFPELQYLDISSNLIEEEDDIMAVASWPCLTEILIADNPLIQHHVGLPPLVESFLIDRLGMKIYRVNPSLKPEKPFYAKPIKKNRQVTNRVTKVPKIPIDQLISGAVKQYIDYTKNDIDPESDEHLIPLLTGTSEQNSSSDNDKYKTIDTTLNDDENKNISDSASENQSPNHQTENIFMTEYENDDIYPNVIPTERPNPPEPRGPVQPTMLADEKYKGFEAFFDIENEKEIAVPNNVIHCVRDLKQILRNPLVVRHDLQIDRRQRPFIPKKMERTLPPIKLQNRPKVEEINKILDLIRDRKTIIEEPLSAVLNNNKDKRNQRRAKSLVTQIQRHYEQVRSVSLRSVRTPGTILDTAIDRLQQFDTNISLNKQSLPSRLSTA